MKTRTLLLIGLVVGAVLSTVIIRRPFAMRRRDIQHHWTGPTLREVKRVASLITLNVPISDVQVSRISGYVGSTSLVLLVRGDVELGTNLQAVEFTEVNLDAKRATLALPPPELSRPRLDLERTCVYRIDRDGLWKILPGRAGERELINQALQQAQSGRSPSIKRELRAKLAPFLSAQRGYAGWLVTNPQFLAELKRALDQWKKRIGYHGLPLIGSSGIGLLDKVRDTKKERTEENRFLKAFGAFFVRWRLEGLASPDLPVPLGPQLPILDPDPLRWHMKTGGTALFLPDIYAVPSRDHLRQLWQKLQDRRAPAHLAGWTRIIRQRGGNATGIKRFGHMLAVKHYWGILENRHPEAIRRNVKHIEVAIGQPLGLKRDSVKHLRREIARRLKA